MNSTTHIAGDGITVCGRKLQRCCWCGEKLCDSKGMMAPLNPDGTAPEFPIFPPGRLVRVTQGNPTEYRVLEDTDKLPEDSCENLVE